MLLNAIGRNIKFDHVNLALTLNRQIMKKLLLISILASILVVLFNKCFCEDPNDRTNSNSSATIDVSKETNSIVGLPIRLKKRPCTFYNA